MTDSRFSSPPLNGCSPCGRDFASLKAFDLHRVGKHDLNFPEHLEGRRCLDVDEEPGWVLDKRGRWTTEALQAQAMKLAEHHARRAMEGSEATEAA